MANNGGYLPDFKAQVNSVIVPNDAVQVEDDTPQDSPPQRTVPVSVSDETGRNAAARPGPPPMQDGGPDYKHQVREVMSGPTSYATNNNLLQQPGAVKVQQHSGTDVEVQEQGPIAAEIPMAFLVLEDKSEPELVPEVKGDEESSNIVCVFPRNNVCWLLLILILIGAILGGLCGSGHCSGGGSSSGDTNNPANRPPPPPPPKTENEEFEDSTKRPSLSPTQDYRAEALATFVNNITFSAEEIAYPFSDRLATPEQLAVEWLIHDDPLRLSVDTASDQFRLRQRYAVLTLWFQSNVAWKKSDGWLTDKGECEWFGIICASTDFGGDVGSQFVITEFRLANNTLNGAIPADVALLTSLRRIDFNRNFLSGSLADSLGNLRSLEGFSIENNSFRGTLPESIGQWTSLRGFRIGFNSFVGTLPDAIGQWANLENFDLGDNLFRGTLPDSIGEWNELENFNVRDNAFTGAIPESIGNWSNIVSASFNSNDFNGTVPSGICNNTTITQLSKLEADCVFEVECSCCTACY